MVYLNLTLSVITQNVKVLSPTLKMQMNREDKKTKSTMYCIEEM